MHAAAFHIEKNGLHCDESAFHHAPPKSAPPPASAAHKLQHFILKRYRGDPQKCERGVVAELHGCFVARRLLVSNLPLVVLL